MQRIISAVLVFILILVGGESVLLAGADEDLLSSRFLTEEQYLKKVPQICTDLYGPMAVPAAKMLWNNAGPVFAMDAMTRAYGEIWTLKGPLTVNERSLLTVSSLVAQGLYPQIKLHINGFIASGGTLDELYALIYAAVRESGLVETDVLAGAVVDGLQWREESVAGFKAPSKQEVSGKIRAGGKESVLSSRALMLDRLSVQIVLGNMDRVREYMKTLAGGLPSNINKDNYMDLLITHLIVYCGYPKGMNAFIVWQQLRGGFGLKP